MLPVRVKVLSSSSCTLSEASSLLQRFLSGDACSDSLARDYVANVAQALQDSISTKSGESGAPLNKHRHFPSSSLHLSSPSSKEPVDGRHSEEQPPSTHGKLSRGDLHGYEKQRSHAGKHNDGSLSLPAAGDDWKAEGLAIAENVHKRHKKKRRHSAIENGTETVSTSMQEADDYALMHHDKKRRKKEKFETKTEHIATENFTPDTQKRRKKEKCERVVEHIGIENVPLDDQKRKKKEKDGREGEHIVTEILTPDKERHHEKKKRKDKQEAETNNIETATPTLDDSKSHEKKKRKKEKQSKNSENVEILQVNEIASPPTSIMFDESLDMKFAKGKKKRDSGSIGASRVLESGVADTPLSLEVNKKEGSSKRKRKQEADVPETPDKITLKKKEEADASRIESVDFLTPLSPRVNKKKGSSKRKTKEEAGVLMTPDKITPKKNTEKTDVEALPEELGSFDLEEKNRKKKKRKRKEEPQFD